MNILQRLEEGFKNSQQQLPTEDYLYEKLKKRLEEGIPEYIMKNKKTIVDILEEKLNIAINKANEYNERNISEQQICEHTNQQQQQ